MIMSLYWLASHPWPRRQPLSPQNQQERRPPRMHKLFGTLMPFSTTTSKRRFFTSLRRTPTPLSSPPSEESMKLALFLSQQCPSDILPKILAYCTPQKIAALSRVNWQWNLMITDDATWRILCEELYKVRLLWLYRDWAPRHDEPVKDSWNFGAYPVVHFTHSHLYSTTLLYSLQQ